MQIAKWIIAVVAAFNFGGLVADALVPVTAKQHLWNPRWPAHAKFHNGQTMLTGILGGLISVAILFGFRPLTLPRGCNGRELFCGNGSGPCVPRYRLD